MLHVLQLTCLIGTASRLAARARSGGARRWLLCPLTSPAKNATHPHRMTSPGRLLDLPGRPGGGRPRRALPLPPPAARLVPRALAAAAAVGAGGHALQVLRHRAAALEQRGAGRACGRGRAGQHPRGGRGAPGACAAARGCDPTCSRSWKRGALLCTEVTQGSRGMAGRHSPGQLAGAPCCSRQVSAQLGSSRSTPPGPRPTAVTHSMDCRLCSHAHARRCACPLVPRARPRSSSKWRPSRARPSTTR